MMHIHNVKGFYIFYIILYLVSMHLFKANNVFSWIYKFMDRLLCCQFFKNSLQTEVHFELLVEKYPLISVDLEPQILSYELSKKYGVILIEMIEYTFCVMMI